MIGKSHGVLLLPAALLAAILLHLSLTKKQPPQAPNEQAPTSVRSLDSSPSSTSDGTIPDRDDRISADGDSAHAESFFSEFEVPKGHGDLKASGVFPQSDGQIIAAFEHSVGPILARSLPEARRSQIFDHFRKRLNKPLEPTSFLCWSEGTPANIVEASHRAEVAANQLIAAEFTTQAFQSIGSGRWTSTATDGGTGFAGTPITLTWSFAPDGTMTDSGETSNLFARMAVIYAGRVGNVDDPPGAPPWYDLFAQAFNDISRETGITFVYEPNDDGVAMSQFNDGDRGVRGDLRILGADIDGNSNVLAYNYSPGYGDMVIDTNDSFFANTSNNSQRLRNVVGHEVGHGLGLGHVCPINGTKLMEPFINLGFTGVQFDEVFSLQRRYGDHLERHLASDGNNDTVGNATPLLLPAEGTTLKVPGRLSIDDNSDTDVYQIDVTAGQHLIVTTTPTSEAYSEGGTDSQGDCLGDTDYDFSNYHDLSLEIIGPDGTTILASRNDRPVGEPETIGLTISADGSYHIRVSGDSTNNNQIYSLEVLVAQPVTSLTLSSSDLAIDESDVSNTGSVVLNSSVAVLDDISVTLLPTGTANQTDYSGSLTATIPAGQTASAPVVVTAESDFDLEGTETLTLTIPDFTSGEVFYSIGVPSSQTIQIIDQPTPKLVLGNVSLSQESFSLQNGAPDPGETIVLDVSLDNIGNTPAASVSAVLSGASGFIPFSVDKNYGDLNPSASLSQSFTFALNGSCAEVTKMNLDVSVDGIPVSSFHVLVMLGAPGTLDVESFEDETSIPTGWSSTQIGSGSGWSVSSNQANDGDFSLFAVDSATNGSSILTSPSLTLPDPVGGARFSHFYDTETNWDGGVLEISIDGGPWQDIVDAGGSFTANGYNLTLFNSDSSISAREAWSGDSNGFVITSFDFPPSAAGSDIRLRWIMGSDFSVGGQGWYIDDFLLHQSPDCDTSGPAFTLTSTGDSLSESDPELSVDLTVTTNPALPTAAAVPIKFLNSGSADPSNDVTGLNSIKIASGATFVSTTVSAVADTLVEGEETLSLTLAKSSDSAAITIADTLYGSWAAALVSGSGKLPNEDFDGDGSLNIEEFVYGSTGDDPSMLPATNPIPAGDHIKIPMPPEPLPTGVTVTVETSTDLEEWSSDDVTVTPGFFEVPLGDAQLFIRFAYTVGP